jgi:cytochrome P450
VISHHYSEDLLETKEVETKEIMASLALVLKAAQTHKWQFLILAILAGLTYVIVHRIFLHPLARYPGPLLGKFTDFYSFYGVYNQNRTKLQYDFLQKYGSPVRFSTNELVFSDLKTVSEIYGQSSSMPDKERTISEALSATGEASLLNTVNRVQHGRIRRLLSNGFSLRSLLDAESVIAEKIDLYVDLTFRRGADASAGPRDIYTKNHELFLDIISKLGFGQSFNCLGDPTSAALQDVDAFGKVVPPQAFFPGFRYLPIESIREGFKGVARLISFARGCVTKHMEGSKERSDSKSILSNMFDARDTESDSRLTMEEIVENTIIFLVAGTSTTAVTLTYVIWECGRRPEIMKKIVEEIRTAFPDRTKVPTYTEASKLVS